MIIGEPCFSHFRLEKMKNILVVWYVAILVVLDQLSKFLIAHFYPGLIVQNKAMFFGLANVPFSLVISVIILVIFIAYAKYFLQLNFFFFALIFAGASSNILDRVFRGAIYDFIPFFSISYINLADLMIFSGLIIYLISVLKQN